MACEMGVCMFFVIRDHYLLEKILLHIIMGEHRKKGRLSFTTYKMITLPVHCMKYLQNIKYMRKLVRLG